MTILVLNFKFNVKTMNIIIFGTKYKIKILYIRENIQKNIKIIKNRYT